MISGRDKIGFEWVDSWQKRSLDIAWCLSIMPIVGTAGALALGLSRKIDGKEPLFSHQRIGRYGQVFVLRKVRTMTGVGPYEINNGTYDPRATNLGKRLRKYGIDEVPQIWNILKGEMSVVGPRPGFDTDLEYMRQVLDRNIYDQWEEAYYLSRPGVISTDTIRSRSDPVDDQELRYKRRATDDIKDFNNASIEHDFKLLSDTGVDMSYMAVEGMVRHFSRLAR